MTATIERAAVAPSGMLLLPTDPPRLGPLSRRLLGRLAVVLAVVEAVGAVLTFAVGGPTARAAGLSLVLPGGGLLYTASPVLFALTAVAVVVALVLWWGASAHFAIPAVWLASGVAAVALADGPRVWVERGTHWDWAVWVDYGLAAALVGTAVYRFEKKYRAKRARIADLNAYLASAVLPERLAPARTPDAMDTELLRWCLDFAAQPDDGLKGLDWGEQFHGGTQLRYQLNSLVWALSLYAANNVPNAVTQVERAMARILVKHTDLRVWRYWRTLNLLGNFDANPDPIVRDNIMFSGFLGDALNTYESATGSTRFDEPGSLTFVWRDGRTFAYDHHRIAAAVRNNFDRSRLGFFPCEPGWSFTVCNIMGAQALHGHDTIHGTADWPAIAGRWQRTLEDEYQTPDGAYSHIRSNHVGLSWDTGEVPGGEYFANGTGRMYDLLPAHARRARALELRGLPEKMAGLRQALVDGKLHLQLPAEPERNKVRRTPVPPWTKLVAAARMVADHELAEAALAASVAQCATGRRWPERPLDVGAAGLGGHMIVRWSAPLDLAALSDRGYQAPAGPVLADTAWDDVVVALARSADGAGIDLSLEPWRDGPCEAVPLRFTGLRPGGAYRLRGAGADVAVEADGAGAATATVTVAGRTDLHLAPEAEARA